MSLSERLKVPNKKIESGLPVWEGPEGLGPQGGITQSMIGRFLSSRELFRILTVDGLAPYEGFSAPLEYGSMWHEAEEAYRNWTQDVKIRKLRSAEQEIGRVVRATCEKLQKQYPMDAEKVAHWYQMCCVQFPEYLKFWERENEKRTVLFSEQTFDVPYKLPWSKRTVRLRGKWDGGSQIDRGVWLDENKTKSQIDQQKIVKQLRFDLQTMTYLVAMHESRYGPFLNECIPKGSVIGGVRYNVIRRSAHKTPESMLKKLTEDVADGRGGEWFGRWCVPISIKDIEEFKRTCLDPILETLCVWWDYVAGAKMTALGPYLVEKIINFRHPYGVWNSLDEGNVSEYDAYIESGSRVGLRKITNLFPELQE